MNRPVERGSGALVLGLLAATVACAGQTVPTPAPVGSATCARY